MICHRMLTLILLASCAHRPPQPSVRPFELSDVPPMLEAAAGLADAIPDDTPAACYATASVAAALRSAASVMPDQTAAVWSLPAVDVDVSGCGPLPEGTDVPAAVDVALASLSLVALAVEGSGDCRAAAWVRAAVAYAQGAAPAIIDEISSPDGVVVVPAVAVDLSGCPA